MVAQQANMVKEIMYLMEPVPETPEVPRPLLIDPEVSDPVLIDQEVSGPEYRIVKITSLIDSRSMRPSAQDPKALGWV